MIWPFSSSSVQLTPRQRAQLDACMREPAPERRLPIDELKWVVVDVETSGLDPRADRLLAIGAVTLERGLIRLDDCFHVTLKQTEASSSENILIHGIDGSTQTSATDPADALLAWLAFARRSPRVAFHAPFDRAVLERASRNALGAVPAAPWLDLAELAPACLPGHERLSGLDEWLQAFGIVISHRHHALGDALATAQLFQIALAAVRAEGCEIISDLLSLARSRRWLPGR